MGIEIGGGILGLIGLLLTIWAIINVFQSTSASPLGKAVWIVVLLVIPVLGFIAWLIFGPRSGR